MNSMIQIHDKFFEPYLSPEEIDSAIEKIANQITHDYKNKTPLFIGVLNGSFMFVSDLMKKIDVNCELSFIKLSSYEGTHSTEKMNQLIGLATDLTNRDIIILEDIVDTGNTLSYILDLLENHSYQSLKIATLLFKPEVYKKKHPIDYIGLEIPNTFVVGFGLDYNEQGRNLKEIYKLSKA